MMEATKHLLLFGDQSVEKLSAIQHLVRNSKTSPAARRFLQEATDVVQLEFSRLGQQEHGWYHACDSLLGMAEELHVSESFNIVASTVLMCIGRLGQLIVRAEEDPGILGSSSEPVEIIALCSGGLPAAAVMAAKDTSELFALSREIISISFRLAYEVRRHMRIIEDVPKTWGRTYVGLTRDKAQGILNRFHESQNTPEYRRIAIGVVAKGWLTFVGPPSSLEALASWSTDIKKASHIETHVPGPIHSKYIPRLDTNRILGKSPLLHQQIDHSKAHMVSPASCQQYENATLGSLLEQVTVDIAHKVLNITDSIQASVERLQDIRNVKLTVLGPTNHVSATVQALKSRGIEYRVNDQSGSNSLRNDMARGGSNKIAIVGMAGKFPGSQNVEQFWEDLLAGKCHIKEVPKSRFDLDTCFDPKAKKKNTTTARHGAWLDEPGAFDNRLFNISPREATQMDPGHRMLMTVSYEALQSAGYSSGGGSLANGSTRIATYFGQAAEDWRDHLNARGADIYYVPGLSRAFSPGRVNYYYKWSGGSYALDTACSTSATGVSLACSALMDRECDMALAGGVAVLNSPNTFSGLSKAGMLSTTAGCRTFHDDADGYSRGEGAGVVVLKRLEDAVADNDNILAIITGSARTYSSTATSITHPCATSQQATYREVLHKSSIDPEEVAYIEMHGTGTQAGDFEEMTSVINTFAAAQGGRNRDNPLTVGAVKAAIGHGEGSAGVASLIKVIMMLRERQIPPQPGWPFKLNHKFPRLEESNVKIATKPTELRPSPKGDKKIKMLVNSFDASGGNVSLVVEEAPLRPAKSADPRAWHVVALSGRTTFSLQRNRERLLEFMERRPDSQLADLAYTTTARRIHEPLRCAYVGSSTSDIIRQLRTDVQSNSDTKTKSRIGSRVFLFTGQGSQYMGMGADLFRECQAFRETLLTYQETAIQIGMPEFIDLISDAGLARGFDMSGQSTTKIQLAIVALEIAMAHVLKGWGIMPDAVIGHSLGEYSALCVAGVLSVSDTLLLVGRRAALMEKHLSANEYAMLATNRTEQHLQTLFGELSLASCNIACVNTQSITVASGNVQDIETLQKHMETEGARTTLLRVPYGFHSSQIDPILGELQQVATGVVFAKPRIPIVSTLTGRVEQTSSSFSPEYLAQQARQKVRFAEALQACKAAGLCGTGCLWVEIGPDPVCLGLARRTLDLPAARLLPTLKSGENNWHTVSNLLKGVYELGGQVSWPEFHRHFKGSLTLLDLPLYAFDSRDFWSPYTWTEDAALVRSHTKADDKQAQGIITSSVHYLEDEKVQDDTIRAIFTSHISDPNLLAAVKGHVVSGHTICPLGVFHDMALTAAKYVYHRMRGNNTKLPHMSIEEVEMSHALVVDTTALNLREPLVICVKSSYRVEDKLVDIEFHSRKGANRTTLSHGKCRVSLDESDSHVAAWKSSISQTLFLLNSRIDALRSDASIGKAHRLLKPVVYQLFSGVVSYGSPYQALEEVVMDSQCTDAAGTVKIPDVTGLGSFHLNPYETDAVTHLAGFVLNSGLRYPPDTVCIAVGYDKWCSVVDIKPGETYTSYVCMQEVPNSHMISGDCYVFHGRDLVQATLGIKFLRVKKHALNTILGVKEPASTVRAPHAGTQNISLDADPDAQTYKTRVEEAPGSDVRTVEQKMRQDDAASLEVYSSEVIQSMLSIIATETGCALDDITDESRYTDLGVDSLMTINILSTLSRDVGCDLPASFFLDNETIGDSKRALQSLLKTVATPVDDGESPAQVSPTQPGVGPLPPLSVTSASPASSPRDLSRTSIPARSDTDCPTPPATRRPTLAFLTPLPETCPSPGEELTQKAAATVSVSGAKPSDTTVSCKVVHYQGSRSSAVDKLFFIADETGSTFGYIQLPSLGQKLGVYGVDSPFVHNPAGLVGTDIKQLASLYRAAIQKEQPSGEYMLGGTSAGALIAFEVARQLLEAGQVVRGLLILDGDNWAYPDNKSKDNACLHPKVKEHRENTLALAKAHDVTPFTPPLMPKITMQILAKGQSGENESRWARLLPGLLAREVQVESGSFLSITGINLVGRICNDAVQKIRSVG